MKKLYLLTCILILSTLFLKAQDPSFSQFYANRLYLNPGFTGTQSGLTLGLHYRNQWHIVPGGFTTYTVWADLQEPFVSSGFGVIAMRDEEGAGSLVSQNFGLSYSYIARFSKTFNINIGVRTSYNQKFVDWSKLVFSDQLHPIDGIVNGTNAVEPVTKSNFVDFDAGFVARWQMNIGKKEINSNIGFSVSHLTQPEESLQSIGTKLPRKFTGHLGTMIPFSFFKNFGKRLIYLSPNIKVDYQGDIQVYSYGLYLISSPIYVGAFYQNRTPGFDLNNTNFVTIIGGVEVEVSKNTTLNIGYSYDLSLTGLNTKARGIHELSMKINFSSVSMFGVSSGNSSSHGNRKAKSMRRNNKGNCYRFKGSNSVNIY